MVSGQSIIDRATTPSTNGNRIIKIGTKGNIHCQIGNGPEFTIDATDCHNQFVEHDRAFRDETRKVPAEKSQAYNAMTFAFVQQLSGATDLTLTMALEFITKLGEEVDALRGFFDGSLRKGQSSPPSSETRAA